MLCDNLPLLTSYEDAKQYYFTIKPYVRGKNKGLRPLGKSRRHDRSLIELQNHGQPSERIVLSLYNHPVVVRHSDGSISLSTCGYETSTTAQFMSETTDNANLSGISIRKRGGKIFVQDKHGHNHKLHERITHVSADGEVSGAEQTTSLVLDRAKFRSLVQPYADFIAYCKSIANVDTEVDRGQLSDDVKDAAKTYGIAPLQLTRDARRWSMDPDRTLHAFLAYVQEAASTQEPIKLERYYTAYKCLVHAMPTTWSKNEYGKFVVINNATKITKAFHDVIKHIHSKEIFNETPTKYGRLPNTSNKKYL